MAGWVSSYTYNGVKYNRGDALTINGNYYYDITDTTSNGTLSNATRYFYGVYVYDDGSLPLNPVGLMNSSSHSSPTLGTCRFSDIASGGTPQFTVGTATARAYDNRNNSYPSTGGWFESLKIEWSGFSYSSSNPVTDYHIYYRECPDGGNTPNGNWSGWVGLTGSAGTSGSYTITSVNQGNGDSSSSWGGRGYWYQFVVIGIMKDGSNTGWGCTTGYVRKCLSYKQSFNANGGSGAPSAQYKFTSYDFVFPSTKPTRTGYSFVGWNSSASAGDGYAAGYNTSNVPDSPVTWYAIWKPNNYTLTLNANGGSVATTSCPVTYDSGNYSELSWNIPTRTGYTFKGWYTAASGGTQVYNANGYCINEGTYWSGSQWKYTGNVTLYAQWSINQYTLTINPNGGTWNSTTSNSTATQEYGTTKTIANPTRSGYRFTGWTLSGSGSLSGTTYTYGAGNCTLKANWVAVYYLDLNVYLNGSVINNTSIFHCDVSVGGSTVGTNVCDYYKEHDTGSSWSVTGLTTASGYTRYSTGTTSGTLTAKTSCAIYIGQNYTITYNANGGTGATTQTVNYGTAWTTKGAVCTKTGYTHTGWNTNASGTGTSYSLNAKQTSTQSANLTLYAVYTPNNYTYNIVYKSKSGIQLGTNSVTHSFGSTNSISPKSFTGYTSPSAQSIKWDSTSAKTITFIYEPTNYSITYDLDGGSASNPTSYTIETETFTLKNPTRTNYEFLGWTGSNGSLPNSVVTITKGSTGNKTYYAIWDLSCYFITFDSNGGVNDQTIDKVTIGESFTIPETVPSREAYIFKGWSKNQYAITPEFVTGDSFIPTSNITLFAVWELDKDYFLKLDVIGCWRTSETTARLVTVSKFFKLLDVSSLETCPSIYSSTLNVSIAHYNLLTSNDVDYSIIDEDGTYFVDEDDIMIQSVNDALEYKYEIILNIDSIVETKNIVLELNDGISSVKKSVRIAGIDYGSDNIYIYKQLVSDVIYDEDGNSIYDENGNEIIAEMNTGGDICEAVEFIESDHILGFQKGGRVYAKEFIEQDGMIIGNEMYFTRYIERQGATQKNVITMDDGSVLIDNDGSIIRTL